MTAGAHIVAIFIAEQGGKTLTPLEEARLVPGQGIVGDRYYRGTGTFSAPAMAADQELTLVESEQIDRLNAAAGRALGYGDARRNVVTRGISLNALIGVEFQLGDASVQGIRLCEPCRYLAGLLGQDVLRGLAHRAGLRARIVRAGTVRPGDSILVPDAVRRALVRQAVSAAPRNNLS